MSAEEEGLTPDPLFVGMTRPATVWGIPYGAFVVLIMVTAIVFLFIGNPLYLLLVRAYRLHEPQMIENTPAYSGCKSWVPLEREIATGNAMPVLDDVKYELKRRGILDRV